MLITFFLASYGFGPSNLFAMVQPSQVENYFNVRTSAYFIPQDITLVNHKIKVLISNAEKEILVAIYWITDNDIINALIEAKKKGIDVQIITDESTRNLENLIRSLLKGSIIPFIYPSKSLNTTTEGNSRSMHNKYLVIDKKYVITGSANLTNYALNPINPVYNFENILIINSPGLAQQYSANFLRIKEACIEEIQKLSQKTSSLPRWYALLDPSYKRLSSQESQLSLDSNTDEELLTGEPADEPADALQKEQIKKFGGQLWPNIKSDEAAVYIEYLEELQTQKKQKNELQ